MNELEQSYAFCRGVARSKARNFYYSFVLLSKPQRDAMCAVYAFMRHSDDLSDDATPATAAAMDRWRSDLDRALRGEYGNHACWPALHDAVRRYAIPPEYLHHMIDGVASDLQPADIQTFDELYRYCFQVASVVGMTVTHIFGYDSPDALRLAERCGIAFQLTNIIRDVREDQQLGRCYLPREDRERYPLMRDLLEFEASRARQYYAESAPLIGMVHRESRPSLWALIEIYRRLLERIEKENYDVFRRRIRLSAAEKLLILGEALLRRRSL